MLLTPSLGLLQLHFAPASNRFYAGVYSLFCGTIKFFHWAEDKPYNMDCDLGYTALLTTKHITSF